MTTAEDCRRKAQQWLREAEATSNAGTSAKMRHVSELWTTLAEHMDRTTPPVQPRDLASQIADRASSVKIGDILRNRLQMGEQEEED